MNYRWDFGVIAENFDQLLKGVGITLAYSAGTIIGGMIIGVICGMALISRQEWLRVLVHCYVELFRCTPLLVQIVWFYYALPIVLAIELPAWLAAGIGLTLYMGAFSSEIFRGGIISIDRGQWQAARALGMTWGELMRYVILPQAIKRMVPPFVNQSVTQLKNTSLLFVVAMPDLMYTSNIVVSHTFRPLEIYTGAAAAYFAMLYPLTLWAGRLEARVDR